MILLDNLWQIRSDCIEAGLPHNISKEQESHSLFYLHSLHSLHLSVSSTRLDRPPFIAGEGVCVVYQGGLGFGEPKLSVTAS